MSKSARRTAALQPQPQTGGADLAGSAAPAAGLGERGDGRDIRSRRPQLVTALAGREASRRAMRVVSLGLIDLLGIFGAILSAIATKALILGDLSLGSLLHSTATYVPLAFLVTVLLFAYAGLYGSRETRPGMARTIATLFQVTIVSLIFALVSGSRFQSYWLFYGGMLFAVVYVSALRYGYESLTGWVLESLGYRRRMALVGSANRIHAVARALRGGVHQTYEAVGFLSLDRCEPNGLFDLGPVEDLPQALGAHAIEEVILTDADFPQDRAVELIDVCQARGVRVRVAPSTMEVLTQRAELLPDDGVPLFEIKPPVFGGFDFAVKRSFDFVLGVTGLILLSPVLGAIALAVKVTSRGPTFHRSLRPGIGGHPFHCLKFRTMYEGAEQRQPELEHLNEAGGAIFKIRDDPRVTPVGRFLRHNSLDELPQLLNVLAGDMSLVGPRPLILSESASIQGWRTRRLALRPGMTGPWQVYGRSNLPFEDMLRYDYQYVAGWSLARDVEILVATIPAVLSGRGAY